jgi:predicted ArsR family transcriptional regulator
VSKGSHLELAHAPPPVLSAVLAKAMAHPIRLALMTSLLLRKATATELATELEEPLSTLRHHLDLLVKLGCVEVSVAKGPGGRGRAFEHFYKAVERAYFDDAAWSALTPGEQLRVTMSIMMLASRDVNTAILRGTFFHRSDTNHLSRSPMYVDEEGWSEVTSILERTVNELMDVETKVADRADGGSNSTFPIKVIMLQFCSPLRGA